MSRGAQYRLSIDIGGTFTDLVLVNEATGEVSVAKVLTTPKDPSIGVFEGFRRILRESRVDPSQLTVVIHATTIVTNTVIERKGAVVGLITTRGFRDVLEIGRERRVTQYDFFEERLPPLVPRYLRKEVDERVAYNGEVVTPLSIDQARRVVKELVDLGVQSIAVCFLHSYANPRHEQLVKELVKKEFPGVFVSISSSVLPEWREYERMSTTVVNAYTQPKTERYLRNMEEGLKREGCGGRLFIMSASGGVLTVETAAEFPVRLLESGPAAGALVGAFIGKLIGAESLLSFDMGGTTAKCCLIERGEPKITTLFEVGGYRFKKGSGYPIKVPTVDLIEIGAGGGSIAHVEVGLLKVGPQSAEADPGPACYGLGGTEPTVTDANLVLGYLNPEYFLGGEMKLYPERAIRAIEEKVARPLGIKLIDAAHGIYEVVISNMARAMRAVSVERGRDPSALALIAFGGAGPLHAVRMAQQLKIKRVVIPTLAGVASAVGMLAADVKFDFVKTYVSKLDSVDWGYVKRLYAEMEAEGLKFLSMAGVTEYEYVRSVDMRYAGQAYELSVKMPSEELGPALAKRLGEEFTKIYLDYYGYTIDEPVEAVNWRLIAIGRVPKVKLRKVAVERRDPLKGKRKAYFPEYNEYVDVKVYDRYKMYPGVEVEGPAIIEERESTTVVIPGARATMDEYGNVVVTM
ncbi:MAG: hydantoinase/oxoprolinase family protein [Candidatus Nezhaarchaeota archaeon]|nr:hydantoinase/oxoprolinase family protein [Candidatus Nezhaarchaeota archaeon]